MIRLVKILMMVVVVGQVTLMIAIVVTFLMVLEWRFLGDWGNDGDRTVS